jgi:hypothetical protein
MSMIVRQTTSIVSPLALMLSHFSTESQTQKRPTLEMATGRCQWER